MPRVIACSLFLLLAACVTTGARDGSTADLAGNLAMLHAAGGCYASPSGSEPNRHFARYARIIEALAGRGEQEAVARIDAIERENRELPPRAGRCDPRHSARARRVFNYTARALELRLGLASLTSP